MDDHRDYWKLVDEHGKEVTIGEYRAYEIENLLFVSLIGAPQSVLNKIVKDLSDYYYKSVKIHKDRIPAIILTNRSLEAYRWVRSSKEEE